MSIAALGVLALALGTLQSVVEPALPLLQRELGVSPAQGALISNVLLFAGAVFTPVAGRLGDRFGGKRVLLAVAVVVSAGGLLAGTASDLPVLLVGQVLQGVMVGALPLSFILVRKNLPAGESQAAIGVVLALFTGGGMVGTLVAGPIAENLAWNWIFLLPTIVIMAATAAVTRLMPHDPPLQPEPGRRSSIRQDLRRLATPQMRNAYLLTFFIMASSGMMIFLLPQLLAVSGSGYGFGAGTTTIGLLLLPGVIAGAVSDSVGGVAAARFGPRAVVVVGTVVTVISLLALAFVHSSSWQLVLAKVLTAFAAGAGTTALLAATATTVETRDTGMATSLLVVTRVVGVALGAMLAGIVLALGTDPSTDDPTHTSFVVGFVVSALVAAAALFFTRIPTNGNLS
ncbi:MFS transporter [Kineosporia babensis]